MGLTLVLCLTAREVSAWQPHKTSTGKRVRWSDQDVSAQIALSVDASGLDEGLDDLLVESAVRSAFHTWEEIGCGACPRSGERAPAQCPEDRCANPPLGVRFRYDGRKPPQRLGMDCETLDAQGDSCLKSVPNGNQVTFIKDPQLWPFGSTVFASTLLSFDKQTGRLVDADIAINDAEYAFCAADCQPEEPLLLNTLTHEVGHVLGLDHSEVPWAAMNAFATPEDSHAIALDADDVEGICTLYGRLDPPEDCGLAEKKGAGCAAAGAAPGGVAALGWLLALCGGCLWRHRRRRRLSFHIPGRAPR